MYYKFNSSNIKCYKRDQNKYQMITKPGSLRDVFRIYFISSINGEESMLTNKIDTIIKVFNKERNAKLLDTVVELVKDVKNSVATLDSFYDLTENEDTHSTVYYYFGVDEISSEIFPRIFKKLKGVYFLNQEETDIYDCAAFNTSVVVFTNSGYPLLIKTEYTTNTDTYRGRIVEEENCSIYSDMIFTHSKHFDQRGDFRPEFECSRSKLLKSIQPLIFKKDSAITLMDEVEHPENQAKDGLIYAFFQCAFGVKKNYFAQNVKDDDWVPLCIVKDGKFIENHADSSDDEFPSKKRKYK
ncbi:predicted protein [Naegleria gruberi]|uniref:Predicted protein n=1 Tax=Naegleria gruberi TaxID=5762 RepID=D2VXL5_NAEGR|nr:uncharacterized protein NAEGRDRAFT_73792 [Naegleria gruberi]EFC38464.1 predicted protein [Naegleria gruberi]|eukprot:XP_002671208.1 predicted protein [Naegleria gruberi strain NEG-M]